MAECVKNTKYQLTRFLSKMFQDILPSQKFRPLLEEVNDGLCRRQVRGEGHAMNITNA